MNKLYQIICVHGDDAGVCFPNIAIQPHGPAACEDITT
jgi:hypothetical protein